MKLTLSAVFISTALSASVFTPSTSADEAILAGGCFWCMESDFEKLDGVTDVVSGFTGGSGCQPGFEWDGARCRETGVGGVVKRVLPGGETGYGMDVYGEAVGGAFGKPELVSYVASVPTSRCPPGAGVG